MVEGSSGTFYKGTQVFYVPLGFESWRPDINDDDQNTSREIIRWGGYSPEPETTCGGSLFNHDNVFHIHPITGQALLYISYWDAGLRIVDVSILRPSPTLKAFHGLKTMKSGDGLVARAPTMVGTGPTEAGTPT